MWTHVDALWTLVAMKKHRKSHAWTHVDACGRIVDARNSSTCCVWTHVDACGRIVDARCDEKLIGNHTRGRMWMRVDALWTHETPRLAACGRVVDVHVDALWTYCGRTVEALWT